MEGLSDCPLLTRLPVELRRSIFEFYYTAEASDLVFGVNNSNRLRVHLWCKGILNLPLVCKQIYAESIPVLYGQPCLTFHGALALSLFANSIPRQHLECIRKLYLISTPFKESSTLEGSPRSVVNVEWLQACKIIADLPGLRRLEIAVDGGGDRPAPLPWYTSTREPSERTFKSAFDPLIGISAPVDFDVYLHWSKRPAKVPVFDGPIPFRLWHNNQQLQ